MNPALMEFQQAIKQQNEDLKEELNELARWEEEIQRRESTKKKVSETQLPPVRGTVPSLKIQKPTPKEDPVQVAKEQGNEYFKAGKLDDAIRLYTKGIDLDPDSSTTHVLYGNRAMCYLKKEEFEKAERDATICIQMNRTYAKAFYRRALARKALRKFRESRSDLETLLALVPGDNDGENELRLVTQLLREEDLKANDAATAGKRKKIVIAEVDDEDEENASEAANDKDDPAEVQARQARIEKEMVQLQEQQLNQARIRKEAAEREELELQRKRRTHDRVEVVEDDEPSIQLPTPKEPTSREASKSLPRQRNLKTEWTKESMKAPKTFAEFERIYKDVKTDNELLDSLVSLVSPQSYKSVFGVNLTPELLLDLLNSALRGSGLRAKEIVAALATLSRVGELAMFFDDKEKSVLEGTLKLVALAGATAAEMQRFRKAFEL